MQRQHLYKKWGLNWCPAKCLQTRLCYLLLVLLGAFAAVVSQPAFAASCAVSGGGNYSVSVGTKHVAANLPKSQIAISKLSPTPITAYSMQCPGDPSQDRDAFVTFTVSSEPVRGFTDVYPTNLAGLGVRYNFAANSGDGCGIAFDQHISDSKFTITCHILAGTSKAWSWGTSVEFVKTGPLTGGTLTTIPAVSMTFTLNGELASTALTPMYGGTMTGTLIIDNPTCQTENVTVPLGSHPASTFSDSNSTSPARSFNVVISNCTNAKKVDIRLQPVTDDLGNGTIALNTNATATGIGVKLMLSDNTPIQFDQAFRITDSADVNSEEKINFAMKAAYIRTTGPLNPGSANSSIQFTLIFP